MNFDIRHILSESGPIAAALGDRFESRPEQTSMALAIARTMEKKSHLLVEAGTGVGKSFAYLVPAIVRALTKGEVVIIATNTIALQEQLVNKDIPLLRAILDPDDAAKDSREGPDGGSPNTEHCVEHESRSDSNEDADWDSVQNFEDPGEHGEIAPPRIRLKPVLVKGRGNYVSIRRLRLASQRQEKLFNDAAARRSLHAIEDWAYATKDGTLSTLPQLERPGVWDKVQSDSGNCMGRKCPNHQECYYQSARRELEGANLLICNHALFFSDLALRAQEVGFLPKYHHVILDEAHNVEDVAADHFGISLSEGRVQHLLTTLYHPKTGRGYLPQLGLMANDSESVELAFRRVVEAQDACREFFESILREQARASDAASEGGEARGFGAGQPRPRSGRIRKPGIVENVLTPAMSTLAVRLRSLREEIKNEADKFELNAYAIRASEIATDAAALVDQTMPGCAYWVEVTGGDDSSSDGPRFQRVTLACSPIEVGPMLKERLFAQEHSVTLTSATLATRTVRDDESAESGETAFAHAMARLGAEGAKALQLGSPFDHKSQVKLYIDRSVSSERGPASLRQLGERVLHHVLETDGGAFVLFTSFAALNAVARQIRPALEEHGIAVLVQGSLGSRSLILDQFRGNERSVLFGAASFWQGVDVRGRGLRNVVITKLPFDPPDRPLTEARLERIQATGGDPFREESLPRAVIKFKQGFGRLIRSKTDAGRVVVLDSRILTAGYGKRFLDALPKGIPIVTEGLDATSF